MTERKEYELTQAEFDELLSVMKPTPMIMLQCGHVLSTQDMANMAWIKLGNERGFDGITVEPVDGKSHMFFTAVPK